GTDVASVKGFVIGLLGKAAVARRAKMPPIVARAPVISPIGRPTPDLGVLDKKGTFTFMVREVLPSEAIGHPLGLLMGLAIGQGVMTVPNHGPGGGRRQIFGPDLLPLPGNGQGGGRRAIILFEQPKADHAKGQ